MKTAIVTDTNSGLSSQQAERLGVYLIPMPFFIDGTIYFEGKDCTPALFFSKMETGSEIVTSQPPPQSLLTLWDRLLETNDRVLYFPMSSGLSGSCDTAKALAREYRGQVLVVDDRRISVTLMQSVCNAKTLLERGYSPEETVAILEGERDASSIYIAVNTLDRLRKSGRITAAAAAMAAVLHIKPVLQIQGGKLDAYKKVRGMNQAKKTMLEALRQDITTRFAGMKMRVFSGFSGGDNTEGRRWQDEVQKAFPDCAVSLISLPLSICCHTGGGALGVACAKEW